jgi:glycosyltransferase involved in cell wall biosynthesis
MKFLIFTTDLPPLPGSPTSGTALRTYNLAEGLRECGHEVVISPPRSAMEGYRLPANADESLKSYVAELRNIAFDSGNQESKINKTNPDVIICGHWPAWTLARKPSQPLVIDLAGPHLLERHFQGEDNFEGAVYGKLNALSCADFFIVSGNKQKLYFLSFLLKANIPDPEKRICVLPMPLPSIEEDIPTCLANKNSVQTLEQRISDQSYPRFIFGGVFLPWQDPSHGLKVLSEELTKRERGSLLLVGGPHPHYKIKSGTYDSLFSSLESNPYVQRKPLLPFEEFTSQLPGIDVALDLMAWNLERELAITIRTTTYLWSGIPIIYNNFADLASCINEYDAGWCIEPENSGALVAVLNEIYENPSLVKEKSANAFRLAKEMFDRKAAAEKLLSVLDMPQVPLEEHVDIQNERPELCDYSFAPNVPLTQHFSCRMNGLREISFLLGTHNADVKGELELVVFEKDKSSPANLKQIHTARKNAAEIKNNEWVSIEIEPIQDSAGKEFCLQIKKIASEKDTLGPWMMKSSPYPLQGLFEGRKRLGVHSLCLKTSCLRADTNTAHALDS